MRYVLVMLGALAALVIGIVVIFNVLVNTGCIYPANYAERKINESYDSLRQAEEVTADQIPPLCRYVIFSPDGKKLGGDLAGDSLEEAWNVVNRESISGKEFYKVIARPSEYVVLQYRLTPQYQSAFLREHLMEPQNLMALLAILSGIAVIILPSIGFGRKIKGKMQPVMEAVENIKNQNLEYDVHDSGIKEFDDCLSSIDEMRMALKDSLERQWQIEQDRTRQMSALAHDIKTPLTVVRGNAELLSETELRDEQKRNVEYIRNSAVQIQSYVQKLIDVTKSVEGYPYIVEKVMTVDLLGELKKQAVGLVEVYHQQIHWQERWQSETVYVAHEPLIRAVMNIVQNAADHTAEGGMIHLSVEEKGEYFTFIVEDTGKGFTKEALAHGAEPFFMDDESRSDGLHCGIGLYFAKTAAKNGGGKLVLANSEETGGAKAIISFRFHNQSLL